MQPLHLPHRFVATFSIVGFDSRTGELGVAVQSKFLSVGAVVPWAKAGAGAVATQSYANTSYGPRGIELMSTGKTAPEVMEILTRNDPDRDLRQAGIVDARGNASSFTGGKCMEWAGGVTGPGYAAQGNILVGSETVSAMAATFEATPGQLAERLLKALEAGQNAGGDRRGRQSAALLVVREKGGYGGYNDRSIDLRVDDHPQPIQELLRLYELHQLYFAPSKEEDKTKIDAVLQADIALKLEALNYLQPGGNPSDQAFFAALKRFIHTENFEEREYDPPFIDRPVLEFLMKK